MPRRNKNANKVQTTDSNYGYTVGDRYLVSVSCATCPAAFVADDQDQAEAALADHMDNAHDKADA